MKRLFFNKKERHKIYKAAYKISMMKPRHLNFMCDAIITASVYDSVIDKNYECFSLQDFPEFLALKPEDVYEGQAWWQIGNSEIRAKNFELIIKQTK